MADAAVAFFFVDIEGEFDLAPQGGKGHRAVVLSEDGGGGFDHASCFHGDGSFL